MAQLYSRIARAGLTDAAVWTPSVLLAEDGRILRAEDGTPLQVLAASPVTVDGYFDAQFMDALGVEAARPAWRGPASLLVGISHGDAVTVGGVNYTVAEIAVNTPDPGETLLYLRKS